MSFPKTFDQLLEKTELEGDLHYYLDKLDSLKIIDLITPAGAKPTSRKTKYYINDGFFRFWFRFVYPFEKQIEKGLDPQNHYNKNVFPEMANFTAFYFEELCREYCLKEFTDKCPDGAGSWWGLSQNKYRVKKERQEEEIDIVCRKNKKLTLIGECKWTKDPMGIRILNDIQHFKLPAIKEEIQKENNLFKIGDDPDIILFSKSGFTSELATKAKENSIELVDIDKLMKAFI